ncbi:hypothetical protein PPL_10563 [Heterostelium album PN500]|uniref:Uncharacterized protein n=1 Tax=Heterostelium pallidum (strain ATCC 26659 / Pp 5 / PN500) TaxID=670386 RepID=D3BRF3_HETP5|nr:hypothetical protein PPL_10563 [Heterostelium album PN500]EFA75985.1 hypothetical protein PPL_10563 [Heterostelium album PN500]|eukprot:XP_020428119.1 hypothetical protein PPL_10563 [Heterostelium album PN500]
MLNRISNSKRNTLEYSVPDDIIDVDNEIVESTIPLVDQLSKKEQIGTSSIKSISSNIVSPSIPTFEPPSHHVPTSVLQDALHRSATNQVSSKNLPRILEELKSVNDYANLLLSKSKEREVRRTTQSPKTTILHNKKKVTNNNKDINDKNNNNNNNLNISNNQSNLNNNNINDIHNNNNNTPIILKLLYKQGNMSVYQSRVYDPKRQRTFLVTRYISTVLTPENQNIISNIIVN